MPDLRDIIREHGGDLYAGGRAATIPGPGHSKHDRSLSLRLSDDGQRVIYHSFAGELSHGEVLAYLGIEGEQARQATPADRAKERARRDHERRLEEAKDREICRAIWEGAVALDGTAAEAYLWSRGLVAEGIGDLRFHPTAPRWKEAKDDHPIPTHPAMVSLVREPGGAPKALHLTYIAPDGSGKAFGDRSRLMFGSVRGYSVHLGQPAGGVLAVGEGIETCGAYSTLKGVPAWSALSTSGVQNFVPPPRLKRLIIAADGDPGGARAAQALAERACKFCDVEIDPAPDGQDWADVLEASQ